MSFLDNSGAREPVNRVEFNAAIIHFYRGELARADSWRLRLDTTTNWAVVTTGAAISFAFGDPNNNHVVLLLISLLVFFFLLIEARRYRYYDIWQNRVRLLETDYFAPMLQGFAPGQMWRDVMSTDLQTPRFRISISEAIGWRLRMNYIWIFLMLLLSWMLKVAIHPTPLQSFEQFIQRAAVPPISGELMLFMGVTFNSILVYIGFVTSQLRSASGEIIARDRARERMASETPVEF